MQSIRLLETQQQPVTSRPGSASSKKPYEPWNDIQFSVDGGVASGGNSMSLPVLVGLPGASTDTAAIAPWMTVDPAAQGSATPQAPPRRALFKSSMSKASTSNLSAQQLTPGFLSRHRGGSEASSYTLAANGVNGTPFVVPSDFGDAWHSPSTTSLVRSQGSPAGNDGSSSIGEGRDGKKTLRDRGKDFGRLLKKKASKVGLSKPEGSDDGHSALPIPPLPYPTSVSTTSLGDSFSFSTPPPNPPHSPTQQKEKRWRSLAKLKPLKDKERDNHPAGTYASEITIGEPEITLDTDLNSMEGIIDLNLNRGTRPPHDIKGPAFGSHGTTGTLGSGNTDYGHWDGDPVNSSLGTSEGGGGGGTLSRVNPTFTNPFEMGPSASPTALTGSSRPFNTRQRSNSSGTSPLTPIASSGGGNNNKRSKPPPSLPAPLALGPAPKSAKIPQNVVDPAQPAKDPAWHAPESWDVDKVGPEAEGFSSDEDIGEMSSRLGPIRDVHDPEYDGVIGVSSVQGRRSSLSSSGKPRMKGGTNVFNGIGMIGGIGGGAYGIGYVGYGRLRTRSDAYGGGGGSIASGYARDGMGKDSLTTLRKDSWPDEDMMTRRPSDALSSSTAPRTPLPPFQLRVYRIDGSYHIVECPISTGALDLAHVLRKKLLLPGQHYKLHIRERGRERVLGPQERPINILRRRLEQAGYDESDDLEHLGGEDISFLLRFVFRDANLPTAQPTDEDDVLSGNITS
ncbi:cysteinyl-tRNA synthetase, partial [Tulasnella sp. 427]